MGTKTKNSPVARSYGASDQALNVLVGKLEVLKTSLDNIAKQATDLF